MKIVSKSQVAREIEVNLQSSTEQTNKRLWVRIIGGGGRGGSHLEYFRGIKTLLYNKTKLHCHLSVLQYKVSYFTFAYKNNNHCVI